MTCTAFTDRLADLLEGTLDAEARVELEAHAAQCAACGALLADLRRMQERAATLERVAPPRGSWSRVAARLQADPQFRKAQGGTYRAAASSPSGRPGALPWSWVALAASLVAGLALALVFLQREVRQTPATDSTSTASRPGNATAVPSVESVETELQKATEHFENAVFQLEQIAKAQDSPLDPDTKARFDEGLAVIDKAIVDTRTALRTQPENTMAQESLFDAFRRKVALLQDTIALMNEMRKGNQAGAARLAEGEKS
jgi:hypothetical protein